MMLESKRQARKERKRNEKAQRKQGEQPTAGVKVKTPEAPAGSTVSIPDGPGPVTRTA